MFSFVHSITWSSHSGFPGLFDGSRVVKMPLVKDIPPSGRVAGFEVRVWYRRQPRVCSICSAPGHRPRQCPLNGPCRRCRRTSQVARDFRQAWGSSAQVSADGTPTAGTEGADASLSSEAPGIEPSLQMDVVPVDGVSCSDDKTAWEETLSSATELSSSSRRRRARRGKRTELSSDGPPAKPTCPGDRK